MDSNRRRPGPCWLGRRRRGMHYCHPGRSGSTPGANASAWAGGESCARPVAATPGSGDCVRSHTQRWSSGGSSGSGSGGCTPTNGTPQRPVFHRKDDSEQYERKPADDDPRVHDWPRPICDLLSSPDPITLCPCHRASKHVAPAALTCVEDGGAPRHAFGKEERRQTSSYRGALRLHRPRSAGLNVKRLWCATAPRMGA
jgi:hypothetical protein